MKYKTKYGDLDFWNPYPNLNKFKKIGINLSGGTDSGLVMFMTCREIIERKLDAVIVPITGIDEERPTNIWNAREIVELFKELFPQVNFYEHQENRYTKSHEKDKVNHHRAHEDRLRKEEIQTQKAHDDLNDFMVGPVGGPLPYTLDEKPALVKKYFTLNNKLIDLKRDISYTRMRLEYLKPRVEALSDLSLRYGTADDYVNIDDFLMERK